MIAVAAVLVFVFAWAAAMTWICNAYDQGNIAAPWAAAVVGVLVVALGSVGGLIAGVTV